VTLLHQSGDGDGIALCTAHGTITAMPTATLRYRLPDEQAEFDAARLGSEAMQVLWQIDQHCRSLCKHGTPNAEERRLAEQIRAMIPGELLDI